jgi:uncharacterized protein YdaU (DUF1376 family)
MANESPAFQFYPRDFVADTLHMTAEEIGGYLLILCVAWHADRPGYVPLDEDLLAKNARMTPKQWQRCRKAILGCLKITDDGAWVYSKRMDAERQKQIAYASQKSEAGKKGAGKRWKEHETEMAVPSVCHASAIVLPLANDSSSSASSSASSTAYPESEEAIVRSPAAPLELVPSDSFVPDLEAIYALYPRKGDGKTKGLVRLKAQLRTRESYEQALQAVRNYAEKTQAEHTEPGFIKRFDTWCSSAWRDYIDGPHIAGSKSTVGTKRNFREASAHAAETRDRTHEL